MSSKIKVVVIDPCCQFRNLFVEHLKSDKRFSYVDSFSSANDANTKLPILDVDVVVLSTELSGISGVKFINDYSKRLPDLKFIFCTDDEDEKTVIPALHSAAHGYLLKRNGINVILQSIVGMQQECMIINEDILKKVVLHTFQTPNVENHLLTKRENEIFSLLSMGQSYREISNTLFISLDTVRTHLQHIYRKLDVPNRSHALLKMSAK
jgi:two-component system, NarL family, response regulator LiaR